MYASQWSSPSTTQHSLPGGRYALPGPVLHRLEHASLLGALTAYLLQQIRLIAFAVDRGAEDLYQDAYFPNYHYVRFELHSDTLICEMIRLEDYDQPKPARWKTRDRFEISLRP